MRIWSVHPRYLDRQALIACWRETLLAQAVLAGRTKGYTRHPQLERFRATPDPLAAVGAYLAALADEADARGYTFDRTRIDEPDATVAPIDVTDGQLDLEWAHLRAKLKTRSPEVAERWAAVESPEGHRSFRTVPGPVEPWERAQLP
ncbi:pyrimidine dimer DNA glycosylase/endonuclease V [Tsukamurella hominis]|uniref:pyrimidine dimer DNA glycosylase/endonuclease V n=1 Tax=Tsukamurella hominis TaxID=1970232 RepID=UPI0039ECD021